MKNKKLNRRSGGLLRLLRSLLFSATVRSFLEIRFPTFRRLKARLQMIDPRQLFLILNPLRIIQRIGHRKILLAAIFGSLMGYSTKYIDYPYLATIVKLKISGVDISNCEELPFEIMIRYPKCTE